MLCSIRWLKSKPNLVSFSFTSWGANEFHPRQLTLHLRNTLFCLNCWNTFHIITIHFFYCYLWTPLKISENQSFLMFSGGIWNKLLETFLALVIYSRWAYAFDLKILTKHHCFFFFLFFFFLIIWRGLLIRLTAFWKRPFQVSLLLCSNKLLACFEENWISVQREEWAWDLQISAPRIFKM